MPRTRHPATVQALSRLHAEWASLAHGEDARQALAQLAEREPSISSLGLVDLGQLVERLHSARSVESRDHAARLFRVMLRSQDAHPLIPRAIVQALVPGLVTLARQLEWGRGGDWGEPGAFFSDVVTTAWEVSVTWSGQDRPYAVLDLLSAIRCRMRRQILHQRMEQERHRPGLARTEPAVTCTWPATDVDVLARTLHDLVDGELDQEDAAVMYCHRVLGFSIAELSRMTGRSRRSLDTRRHRAEQALCA